MKEKKEEGKKTHVYKEMLIALEGKDLAVKQEDNTIDAFASIVDQEQILGVVRISAPIDNLVSETLDTLKNQLYIFTVLISVIIGIISFCFRNHYKSFKGC